MDEEAIQFEKIKAALQGTPFVLVWNKFHPVQNVAMSFSGTKEWEKYLCQLPRELYLCKSLFQMLGMKESFETEDYIRVLHIIEENHRGNILSQEVLEITVELLQLLQRSICDVKISQIEETYGTIFLPDMERKLRPAKELCFPSVQLDWIKSRKNVAFTHQSVSMEVASSLGVKTQRSFLLHKHLKSFAFGQKEELTTRLKNIVSSHSPNHEILKELVQNADDSGATEIQFILDKRNHPKDHIFEDCWKPMQGPALCVYNNKPFTKDDLSGIQRLGQGSKHDDPGRIGQYGIGFNAMYHLTDAPVLLTAGPEIGERLCVFDPTCSYAPDTDDSSPGMMIDDLDELKETFTDVFNCFLGEHLKHSNATLFRFVLRGREMADQSPISKTCITIQGVEEILNKLQAEAREILLFTHHISKISIKFIDEAGSIHEQYMCESKLDKADRQNANSFEALSKKVCTDLKATKDVSKVQVLSTTQTMTITDNANPSTTQHWIVSKQIGFRTSLPEPVQISFDNEELMLSPQGGVAILMESTGRTKWCPKNIDGKVFCFLPMPITTGLPFHIQGHFALGYENRRHLWTINDGPQDKEEWNKLLYNDVIVPCYIAALTKVRAIMSLNLIQDDSEIELVKISKYYMKVLPTLRDTNKDWHIIIYSVYTMLNQERFLPSMCLQQESYRFKWLSPSDQHEKGYLFKLSANGYYSDYAVKNEMFPRCSTSSKVIKEVLLHCGMNMFLITSNDKDNLEKMSVCIHITSSKNVIDFFKTYTYGQVLG